MDHEIHSACIWNTGDFNDAVAVIQAAFGVFCCLWDDGWRYRFINECPGSIHVNPETEISRNRLFSFVCCNNTDSWTPFGGFIADSFGSYNPAFYLAGSVQILAAGILFLTHTSCQTVLSSLALLYRTLV